MSAHMLTTTNTCVSISLIIQCNLSVVFFLQSIHFHCKEMSQVWM